MLAPQSGQIRLRMAEIKFELVFMATASEAIMSLPVVAVLHRRMHNTVSGAASAFGEGARLTGLRPLASDSNVKASESPNAWQVLQRSNGDSSAERWVLMGELGLRQGLTSGRSLK